MIFNVIATNSLVSKNYYVECETIEDCILHFKNKGKELINFRKTEMKFLKLSENEIFYSLNMKEIYTEKLHVYLILGSLKEIFDYVSSQENSEIVSLSRLYGEMINIP